MIWLTWRQYRIEVLISILLLIVLGIIFVNSGVALYSAYQGMGLASCTAYPCNTSAVDAFILQLHRVDAYSLTRTIMSSLPFLSLLVGVFIGAPLVAREQDQQTHYFLWTQSITRTRWLIIKLSLIVAAILLLFVALTALTTWWAEPLSRAEDPWIFYDARGLVLPSFAVFSLLVGVTVGTFLRRTVAAMGLTFLILLVVFVILHSVYPYAVPPLSKTIANSNDEQGSNWTQRGDWGLYSGYTDSTGHVIAHISQYCHLNTTSTDNNFYVDGVSVDERELDNCIKEQHLLHQSLYQPAERFWLLQGVVSAVLLLLAVALVPVTLWQLRKRIN